MDDPKPQIKIETGHGGTGGNRPSRISASDHPSDAVTCCSCKAYVSDYLPVLPFMAAYVCSDCIKLKRQEAIPITEISNKSFAPWTAEEVAAINAYKCSSKFLPFVCSVRHTLIAKPEGLFCSVCPHFTLTWTYPWVLNSFWKEL
jgi:hypothetical protein